MSCVRVFTCLSLARLVVAKRVRLAFGRLDAMRRMANWALGVVKLVVRFSNASSLNVSLRYYCVDQITERKGLVCKHTATTGRPNSSR